MIFNKLIINNKINALLFKNKFSNCYLCIPINSVPIGVVWGRAVADLLFSNPAAGARFVTLLKCQGKKTIKELQ